MLDFVYFLFGELGYIQDKLSYINKVVFYIRYPTVGIRNNVMLIRASMWWFPTYLWPCMQGFRTPRFKAKALELWKAARNRSLSAY